jgi:hypothetical protein
VKSKDLGSGKSIKPQASSYKHQAPSGKQQAIDKRQAV